MGDRPAAVSVVLWRHGRTAANATGTFQGQLDVPLDAVGRAQAHRAAPVLAGLLAALVAAAPGVRSGAVAGAALVTSDLSRAADTAAALTALTGLSAAADPALRELAAGRWQGLAHHDIAARWPAEHAAWRSGDDVPIGGAERRSELGARVAAAVERRAAVLPPGGVLVAATHSGAARAGVLALLGLPATAWPALASLGNARWALLQRGTDGAGGGGWVLRGYDLGPRGPVDVAAPGASPEGATGYSDGHALAETPATGLWRSW